MDLAASVTVKQVDDDEFAISALNSCGVTSLARTGRIRLNLAILRALQFAGCGTEKVEFIAPEWVKDEVRKAGFDLRAAAGRSRL